jgi:predicted phage terminase large subunit-like protein
MTLQSTVPVELTPEVIALARRIARDDFYFYSRWMFLRRKGYKWLRGRHHKIICEKLVRVYKGECPRLIINVAPRYSKTELAVINFISWTLGHVPDAEYIHTSYSGRLAANNSWQTRDLVQNEEFQKIFCDDKSLPIIHLKTDSQAKDEWRTQEGGCVYAVGAGGTITGYGAGKNRSGFGGAIVIDDPHKADEARSEVMRQNVIDGFQNTLESRLNSPHTPIILIMQRLHENDLAGWLLNGGNGEEWEYLCLPTLENENTDHETALWPEKHTVDDLHRLRTSKPYTFSGQYQQSPCQPEGNIFKPDQIGIIEAVPIGTQFVRAWDLGATDGSGDYTVGFKLGRLPDGRWLIADVIREQYGPEDVERTLKATAQSDGRAVKIRLPQDPGQAGKAQAKNLTKLLAGYNVSVKPTTGDKITRAEPFAAQVNVGNVVALNKPWLESLKDEWRVFDNGTYDDQVDAGADAFSELADGSFFSDCDIQEEAPE